MIDKIAGAISAYLPIALVFVMAAVVFILIGTVVDYLTADRRDVEVFVVDQFYKAPQTGVGVGVASGGGSAVVVTSSGPDYDLLLEFSDGHREIVGTNKATLMAVNEGEYTFLSCLFGGITHSVLSCRK